MSPVYYNGKKKEEGLMMIGRYDVDADRIVGHRDFVVAMDDAGWSRGQRLVDDASSVIAIGRVDRSADPPRLTAEAVYPIE